MGGPGCLICISDVAQVSCGVIDSVMQRVREYISKAWHWLVNNAGGIFVGLLGVLFVLFLAVIFCEGAKSCISELLGLEEKHEVLRFLGIGMGGILLALQAFASHKRAKAMEDAANAQAEATKQQAKANETTEQGLRQERLKNAIEHLGSSSASVRLGGTYELFHLAEDTKEWRQTVLDILCAHIRGTTGEKEYREQYAAKPSEEVQNLLTLLFVDGSGVFEGLHINLQGSWLNGTELWVAQLQSVDFAKAQLRGATLIAAQFQGADLIAAQFQGANLSVAQFQGADPTQAKLHGVRCEEGGSEGFAERMNQFIGQNSDLSEVIFTGGLQQDDVDSFVKCLPGEEEKLWERLRLHINKPASNELPKDSGAVIGSYTAKEAEQWIAKYNEAMSEVPQADTD